MHSQCHDPPTDSVFVAMRHSGAWRLLLILFVYLTGLLLLLPTLPTLLTNDFASRKNGGERLRCEDYLPKEEPTPCRDAHAAVVWAATWSGFFQNTIFAVTLTPALGAWSDVHGRKPFLLLAMALSCGPLVVVLLNLHIGLPLYYYYAVNAFTGSITSVAPALAYVADVIPPQLRAAAFGFIMASFSIAVLVGPPLGALIPQNTAPVASIAVVVTCMLAVYFALPESLPPTAAAAARQRREQDSMNATLLHGRTPSSAAALLDAAWKALAVLRRTPLFVQLTIILMMSAIVSEGLQDILIQYLQIKLGFQRRDVGHLFMALGVGALTVQTVFLRPLLGLLGEARLLCLGVVASVLQQAALAAASAKWHALTAVCLGSFVSVTFPTISSIKANNAAQHEQGTVQGALSGARALASGLGPIAFASLFSAFTKSNSPLPFFPGAPFVLGVVMTACTAVLAARLPAHAGGNPGKLFRHGHAGPPMVLVDASELEHGRRREDPVGNSATNVDLEVARDGDGDESRSETKRLLSSPQTSRAASREGGI